MQVRLAFATAIQREPDILLVDEVLAVGDMDFQRKCFDIFQRYKDNKVTILFVSHDHSSIRRFCDRAILLDNGQVVASGNTNEVIDQYVYKTNIDNSDNTVNSATNVLGQKHSSDKAESNLSAGPLADNADLIENVANYRSLSNYRWGNKKLEIRNVRLLDKNGNDRDSFISGDSMEIRMEFVSNDIIKRPIFGFDITNEKEEICYGTNTLLKGIRLEDVKSNGSIRIHINALPILRGKYYLSVAAQSEDNRTTYDWHSKMYPFYIINNNSEEGFIRINCDFSISE
jgi:lipopolysaccharide transport system ATP-binding protein